MKSMYDIFINVASAGHPLYNGKHSNAGHAWITMPDGMNAGFAPGGVTAQDGDVYNPGYISVKITINSQQLSELNDFIKNSKNYGYGNDDYSPFKNNCVNFVWDALGHMGLNPDGFRGHAIPSSNIFDFMKVPGASGWIPVPGSLSDSDGIIPLPLPPAMPTPPLDPLALDLNGDGVVSTLSLAKGVHFDLDNSGFAEKTGWVAPEDGFLVLDRNGNNQIDGGSELFGTETTLASGQKATNGFEALKEFDQNGDGKIDSADEVYANLKIWQDKNSNGLADEGELFTLAELSVASIGVNYKNQKFTDSSGTLHQQSGLFIRDDGSSGVTNTLFLRTIAEIPLRWITILLSVRKSKRCLMQKGTEICMIYIRRWLWTKADIYGRWSKRLPRKTMRTAVTR